MLIALDEMTVIRSVGVRLLDDVEEMTMIRPGYGVGMQRWEWRIPFEAL